MAQVLERPATQAERIKAGRQATRTAQRKHRPKGFHFEEIEPGVWLTPSDTHKGISYRLREDGIRVIKCSCPGWETAQKRGRKCKHGHRLEGLLDLPGCEEVVTNDTEEDRTPARPTCRHKLYDPFGTDHELFGYPLCSDHIAACDAHAVLTTLRVLPETARQAA
jgi:hypothetical protein